MFETYSRIGKDSDDSSISIYVSGRLMSKDIRMNTAKMEFL